MEIIKQKFSYIHLSHKIIGLFLFLLIILAIPLTAWFAQRQTKTQQHASQSGSIVFLDVATNIPIVETITPDIKLQLALPDGWELTPQTSPNPSSRRTIFPQVYAENDDDGSSIDNDDPAPTPEALLTPIIPTDSPPPPTSTPSATQVPQQKILTSIVIRNTVAGGDAQRSLNNQQDIITILNQGIAWKLPPLAATETTAARTVEVQFFDQNNQSVTTTQTITLNRPASTTITPPTATGTPSVSRTPSPTITEPTATPSGTIIFSMKLGLQGVGPQGNKTPIHQQRTFTASLYDKNGNKVGADKTGLLTYNATPSGFFEGDINMGTVAPDNYTVKVKTDKYLTRIIANIVSITASVNRYTMPTTPTFLSGDINNDNLLNIEDYSVYKNCLGKNTPECIASSDLNDDGKTDTTSPVPQFLDYKLLISNFSLQKGE